MDKYTRKNIEARGVSGCQVVPKVVWVAPVTNLRVAKFFPKLHKIIYMIQRIML